MTLVVLQGLSLQLAAQPCSGTPVPGNTLCSTFTPCPGSAFTLSIQNAASLGTGITFQWHNATGIIAGATNATFTTSLSGGTETYWCTITCTFSSLSATTTPVTLTVNSFINCYCASSATAMQDEDIYNVTLNGNSTNPLYANSNGCTTVAPGPGSILKRYSSFLTLPPLAILNPGMAASFSILQDECDGPAYFANQIGIWIDFNHNASFSDPGENVFIESVSVTGPRTVSGNFIVPGSALSGNTVMRIVCREAGTPTPCGTYSYGETEDYLVNIIPFAPCSGTPNPGNTTSSATVVCAGSGTTLGLQNATIGATYQWYNGSGAISGATNATYYASISATDSFYCQVTCTGSGLSANSSTLTLTVALPSSASSSASACDFYVWNGNTFGSSGTYIDTFMNAAGCDSVHTLTLSIFQSSLSNIALSSCDSILFGGTTYTNSGSYTLSYTTIHGCDSITSLNLIIDHSYDTTLTHTDCDFYTFNGTLYSTSGLYTHSFTNMYGCDSIIHLNLTINQSTDSVILANACNAFTLNGLTYTLSGNYNQTLLNASGCDSSILIQATIDTLTALLTTSGTGLSTPSIGTYQWINCNTNMAIPGATSLNFTPAAGGSYAVVVTSSSCVDTSICLNVWPAGLPDLSPELAGTISPNPTHGPCELTLHETVDLFIINNMGERILQRYAVHGKQIIDLSAYAVGMYWIRVRGKEKDVMYRLIKE